MSFLREAVRDNPATLHLFDDGAPYQDYSGRSANATVIGTTPQHHPSFVRGTAMSVVLNSSSQTEFSSPVFAAGVENKDFSLEAKFVPLGGGIEEQQVVSHKNKYDGITISNGRIYFTIDYLNTGLVSISADMSESQSYHVVATKTSEKMSLFVNGEVVAQRNLTPEEILGTYDVSGTQFQSGLTVGGNSIALGLVSTYSYALDYDSILRHYTYSVVDESASGVPTSFGADVYGLSVLDSNTSLIQEWGREEDWLNAQMFNVAVVDNQLRPVFSENVSLSGYWIYSLPLDSTGETAIHSVSLDWHGEGVVIEASIDGSTWETAQKSKSLSVIPSGFNPTDQDLQIRASFAGGIESDPSRLSNLSANIFKTNKTVPHLGREVTFNNASPQRRYSPTNMHELWGSSVSAGGSIVLSTDTSPIPSPVGTVEIWIKRTTSTNPTVSISGDYYQDGSSASSTLPLGQWTLLHVVATTPGNNAVTVTGPAQIGQLSVYDQKLTAQEIDSIHSHYTRASIVNIEDISAIDIQNPTESVQIYSYDWAIQGAG